MKLNVWLWKWHFLGGIFSLLFALIFSLTGILYLFREMYEAPKYEELQSVKHQDGRLSFQEQWEILNEKVGKKPGSMIIPNNSDQATEFRSGMHGTRVSTYIDPFTGEINGDFSVQKSDMYIIRKLHGELLGGSFGAIFTELAAGWLIVLIVSGIYIWWPKSQWRIKGFFTIITDVKKRLVWRDIHVVFSFWASIVLLLAVVSGLPFTNIFGKGYTELAKIVGSDYPAGWREGSISSQKEGERMSLDQVVEEARKLNLKGTVSVAFPKSENGVFRVFNRPDALKDQRVLHLDQYSGKVVAQHDWQEVGSMIKVRQWLIRFHEGTLGQWSWWLMLVISVMLILTSVAAIYSYLLRKKKGSWGVPATKAQFKVGMGMIISLVLFSVMMPIFGLSVGGVWVYERMQRSTD